MALRKGAAKVYPWSREQVLRDGFIYQRRTPPKISIRPIPTSCLMSPDDSPARALHRDFGRLEGKVDAIHTTAQRIRNPA